MNNPIFVNQQTDPDMKSRSSLFFLLSLLALILIAACNRPAAYYQNTMISSWDSASWTAFHTQAAEESLLPVRPGVPGQAPFWNAHARRFIHAPSFDFPEIQNAAGYKIIAISDTDRGYHTFESDRPWALLTPIWKDLPVGLVHLKVEALDHNGQVLELAGERIFYRAAIFEGPYRAAVKDYGSSVTWNLQSLLEQEHYRQWAQDSIPSKEYYLYCYPSKIVGSIIRAMCMYAGLSGEEKDLALSAAKNAADYLIRISLPSGAALEYFPPTYLALENGTRVARERKDQLMMFYPAIVGGSYLDLYELSADQHYLEAALRIAGTYVSTQLSEGSWPLMVWMENGEAVEENLCVPTPIIQFLERLGRQYGYQEFLSSGERAFQWIMDHPMQSFHWEGQFEDVGYSRQYSNLERGKPLAFASLLFDRSGEHPEYVKMAEELIRFAEDQFIVWERPLPREMFRTPEEPIPHNCYQTSGWFTPCALEQYGYYTPIDASAASAISAFQKAFEYTGKELYLAKAISLADNMTVAQELAGGIYPTYQRDLEGWTRREDGIWQGWLNCATITSESMLKLHDLLQSMNK